MKKNRKESTIKNKFLAVMLVLVGWILLVTTDGDGTFLVMSLIFGIPVFFAKKDVTKWS